MTDTLTFRVRSSSSDELYEVVAHFAPQLRISCTCQGGINGTICKHRTALLLGEVTSVVEVDPAAVERLSRAAAESPLGRAMKELDEVEREAELLKRQIAAKLSAKRKQIARIMNHGA